MKWSSGSNSSLSALALNISNNSSSNNNNNSIGSSGSSNNSSYSNVNGGSGIIRTKSAAVRRHASDRRSIFYTDPEDMEIFTKNHNNKKVRYTVNLLIIILCYLLLTTAKRSKNQKLISIDGSVITFSST